MNASLQAYIEQEIIPRYDHFDKAHNRHHVQVVIERSLAYARQYNANIDMAYTIAAYHDVGLCEGRELHHIVSGRIVATDKRLQQWFTPEQIATICEAVEDHRASSRHAPRSVYGCIVAEADRQIDTDITLRRTIQYGLKHLNSTNRTLHYNRFVEHLQEKYAEGGYMQLWLPESDNAHRLKELRTIIANKTQLREIFDRIFDEECNL